MPNVGAHRPPIADFWTRSNSKERTRSVDGGSVQRHCSAACSYNLKLPPANSLRTRRDGRRNHGAPNSSSLRTSATSATSALKNKTRRRREHSAAEPQPMPFSVALQVASCRLSRSL